MKTKKINDEASSAPTETILKIKMANRYYPNSGAGPIEVNEFNPYTFILPAEYFEEWREVYASKNRIEIAYWLERNLEFHEWVTFDVFGNYDYPYLLQGFILGVNEIDYSDILLGTNRDRKKLAIELEVDESEVDEVIDSEWFSEHLIEIGYITYSVNRLKEEKKQRMQKNIDKVTFQINIK